MYLVNKYILKNLFKNFLVATFLFVFIALLTRLVHYAEIITEDGGSITDLLLILTLIQPKIISILTPFTASLSAFITYNGLIKANEHIAFYNAKLSEVTILKPLCYFCFILFIFVFINFSFVVPHSYKNIEKIKNKLAIQLSTNIVKPEEFITQKGVIFFVHDITFERLSRGIIIIDKRNQGKTIFVANEGKIYFTNGIFGIRGEHVYLYKRNKLLPNGMKSILESYDFSITTKESLQSKSSSIEFESNKVVLKALKNDRYARKEFLQRMGMPFFVILLPLAIAIILLKFFNFSRNRISYSKVILSIALSAYIGASGFGAFGFFTSSFQNIFLYFINIFLIFLILLFTLNIRFFLKFFR